MLNNKFKRLLHIFLVMLITVVIITAIINTTLLSKASIMEIIEYALTVTGLEITPVDSIFIARLIRQQIWEVHFYIGLLTLIFSIILFLSIAIKTEIFRKEKSMSLSLYFNTITISFFTLTGILLFYRDKFEFAVGLVEDLRLLHWFSLYAGAIFILFHLYLVVTKKVS